MTIALWIAQGLLAAVFLAVGITKLKDDRETYAAARPPMTTYASRMPVWLFRTVGVLEVAGALGVVLPWATGIAPVLTPVAAAGLALIMVGAAVDHARHRESASYPVNAVLFALAAVVALGRLLGW